MHPLPVKYSKSKHIIQNALESFCLGYHIILQLGKSIKLRFALFRELFKRESRVFDRIKLVQKEDWVVLMYCQCGKHPAFHEFTRVEVLGELGNCLIES